MLYGQQIIEFLSCHLKVRRSCTKLNCVYVYFINVSFLTIYYCSIFIKNKKKCLLSGKSSDCNIIVVLFFSAHCYKRILLESIMTAMLST